MDPGVGGMERTIGSGDTVGIVGNRSSVCAFLGDFAGRCGQRVSLVGRQALIPDLLTGAEWLSYRAGVAGGNPAVRLKRIREAASLSALGPRLDQRIGTWRPSEIAVLAVATELSIASGALIVDEALDSCSDDVIGSFARAFWARTDLTTVISGSDRVVGRVAERIIEVGDGQILRDEPTSFFLAGRVLELEVASKSLKDLALVFRSVSGSERTGAGVMVPLGPDRNAQQVLDLCRAHGIPILASHIRPARFHKV
jgi:hypothetical protein